MFPILLANLSYIRFGGNYVQAEGQSFSVRPAEVLKWIDKAPLYVTRRTDKKG